MRTRLKYWEKVIREYYEWPKGEYMFTVCNLENDPEEVLESTISQTLEDLGLIIGILMNLLRFA